MAVYLTAFKGVIGVIIAVYLAYVFTAVGDHVHRIPVQRPHAQDSPVAVMAKHGDDCWTGAAPDPSIIPGHVVWQHPDGTTVYSRRLTGPALETLFGDGNLPGRAIAFCK
jgi:hypothetical protein